MENVIKILERKLSDSRETYFCNDDDEVFCKVTDYFRRRHYKIILKGTYTVLIKKKWWMS